jgi:hypothetical protein
MTRKNNSHHSGINRSSYKAKFGCDAKIGLSTSSLPHGLLYSLETEEDLVEHLNRVEEEGNDLRAPGHLDQPDTQDDGLEIEICTVDSPIFASQPNFALYDDLFIPE